MKKLLRILTINFFSLWLTARIFPAAISYQENWQTLFGAAAALGLVNLVIKPLIKLLLLPITILTLGAFRWVINVLGLYFVTFLVPGFSILAFDFAGLSYRGFTIPSFHASLISAYIILSFALSLISSFIYWLIKN